MTSAGRARLIDRGGRSDRGADIWVATILVVEDDESVSLTLQNILEAEGYQVQLAPSLAEALAQIERTSVDALLLDLRLGEADAVSALRRLRERSPGALGIVLTGYGSLENAVQAVRAGADDFLVKPADVGELKASITRALDRRAQADEPARQALREQTARTEAEASTAAAEAARQHLDDLFMHVPAMIVVVRGPQHVVEFVNPLFLRAVGGRKASEMLGKRLREALPEFDAQEYFERLAQVYAGGQPYIGHEMPAKLDRRGDGRLEEGFIDVVMQPLGNTQGEIDGIVTYAFDVTEYVWARQRAEELDQLKEEFIATASHDLKSPLTSIQGHTQLLLRRVRDPTPDLHRIAEGLAVIDSQTSAMTRLLDDLLDASRVQAGGIELRTAPCDLGMCLERILARLGPDERVRVEVTLPDAPLAGEWEQTRIEQVLANLVGNAVKYSPDNERVRVTIERRAEEIEVTVSDRGMGIPAEEQPRLFERFHRTPQALASGLSGTGLGLYISCGIVTAHGGRIWVESPGKGQGAAFHFTLPIGPRKRQPETHQGSEESW